MLVFSSLQAIFENLILSFPIYWQTVLCTSLLIPLPYCSINCIITFLIFDLIFFFLAQHLEAEMGIGGEGGMWVWGQRGLQSERLWKTIWTQQSKLNILICSLLKFFLFLFSSFYLFSPPIGFELTSCFSSSLRNIIGLQLFYFRCTYFWGCEFPLGLRQCCYFPVSGNPTLVLLVSSLYSIWRLAASSPGFGMTPSRAYTSL